MQFLKRKNLNLILKVNFKFRAQISFSFIFLRTWKTKHNYDNIHITYILYISTGNHHWESVKREENSEKQKKINNE